MRAVARNALNLTRDVDREVTGMSETLIGLSTSPVLLARDYAAFYNQAAAVASSIKTPILLRDVSGQQLLNTRRPYGADLPREQMPAVDDAVRAASGPAISDLIVGAVAQKPLFTVAVPVWIDSKLEMFLHLSVEPRRLRPVIDDLFLDYPWMSVIADRHGKVISAAGPPLKVGDTISMPKVSNGPCVSDTVTVDGNRHMRGICRTRYGWYAAVSVPYSYVDDPVHRIWLTFVITGIVALALASTLATWLASRIAQPIQAIAREASALGNGAKIARRPLDLFEANEVQRALSTASHSLVVRNKALAANERRFRSIFEQAAVGFGEISMDGRWRGVNARLCNMLGYTREECLAHTFGTWTHPDDQDDEAAEVAKLVSGEQSNYVLEKRFITKSGKPLWVQVTASLAHGVHDDDYMICVVEDISEQRQQRTEAARLAAVVQSAEQAVLSVDTSGLVETWNSGAMALFGYSKPETDGMSLSVLFADESKMCADELIAKAKSGEATRREALGRRSDGITFDMSVSAAPIFSATGRIETASFIIDNISDQKRWQAQIALLNRELAHRVKNSLAVVQSLANQTARMSPNSEVFQIAFQGRLHALAAASDLLVNTSWNGAELRAIIERQLKPLLADTDQQLKIAGPRVVIPAVLTVPLGLALHELGTNALKYGALSAATGCVQVDWQLQSSDEKSILDLQWRETGGPKVTKPVTTGFGTTLIERGIPGATATRQFLSDGFVCKLRLVLAIRVST